MAAIASAKNEWEVIKTRILYSHVNFQWKLVPMFSDELYVTLHYLSNK